MGRVGWGLVGVAWSWGAWAGPSNPPVALRAETHQVGGKHDHQVAMRDGTTLFTRVWVPEGEGPWPVLVQRNPYAIFHGALNHRCKTFVRYGYACLWQDVRGQGRSEGAWTPFVHEADDGADTLAWVQDQPFSNGRVGWMGESYLAATGWMAAPNFPPGVQAAVFSVFGTDAQEALFGDGLIRHELATAWMTLMPERGQRLFAAARYHRALKHRPRKTLDEVAARQVVPWFREWLDGHDPDAEVWQRPYAVDLRAAAANTDVPVLMIGGWSDAFLGPQLSTWSQLGSQDSSTLVVGPWDHFGGIAGDAPPEAVGDAVGRHPRLDQLERWLDWFDHHLQDRPPALPVGEVLTYVEGGDRWSVRDAWPPAVMEASWWLADTPSGRCQGALASSVPEGAVASWVYDPEDPVRSRGGAATLAGALPFWFGVKPGPVDVSDVCEDRADVHAFLGPVLTEPLHLAGPLRAELIVRADVPETTVVVRFAERRDDGTERHIREEIAVVRSTRPGDDVAVSLATWPIEVELHAGSRLVVHLMSSSFPRWEAHPNIVPWPEATETRVAAVDVVLGPSRVVLPVVAAP